jgi:hypothetical protein
MMKRIASLSIIAMLLFGIISCKREEITSQTNPESGQLELRFSLENLKSTLKSAKDTSIICGISSVIVTIEDVNGKVVNNSEKVDVYNMNGNYISKPLSLFKGNYKLTRFLVMDWKNNVVYASPQTGSPKAYLVLRPLPLDFSIQTNVVTKLTPEVINAAESKPEDFGYASFSFSVAKTFDFLIGVLSYNDSTKNYALTDATISILNDTTKIYSGSLTATGSVLLVSSYDSIGVTNKITLPERYNSYTLIINKSGYKTYQQTFTKEELKLHFRSVDKGPLVVILEKKLIPVADGLILYYPFNGNANDASGNKLDGIVHGPTLCADRFGTPNSAYIFKGSPEYIDVPNSPKIKCQFPVTVSVWGSFDNVMNGGAIFTSDYLDDKYTGYWIAHLYINNTAEIVVGYGDGGGNPNGIDALYRRSKIGSMKIESNKWYHIVAIFKGPTDMDVFINGQKDGGYYDGYGGAVQYSNNPGSVGRKDGSYNAAPPYYLNGKVDEIRVYNRVLSEQEILSLYQQ